MKQLDEDSTMIEVDSNQVSNISTIYIQVGSISSVT